MYHRRWLKEDASNRARGSNLERRLAGNTGHLRMFLFGADAKSTTTKVRNMLLARFSLSYVRLAAHSVHARGGIQLACRRAFERLVE